MVTVWNSKREGGLINQRINQAFTSYYHRQYWITIVAFAPIAGYNMFFNIRRAGEYTRSIPIARLKGVSFMNLIEILRVVRTRFQFTFKYVGFSRQERRILFMEVN